MGGRPRTLNREALNACALNPKLLNTEDAHDLLSSVIPTALNSQPSPQNPQPSTPADEAAPDDGGADARRGNHETVGAEASKVFSAGLAFSV